MSSDKSFVRDLNGGSITRTYLDVFGREWVYGGDYGDTWAAGMSGWHCPSEGARKQLGAGHLTYIGPFKEKRDEVVARKTLAQQVADLEAQLAEARRELADAKPPLPKFDGAVIKFDKFDYAWAAIKVKGKWYVTQDGSRTARQGIAPMTDDAFLAWVYESNWDSIEQMF